MSTGLRVSFLASKCVFTDQNILQRGDPVELDLEVLEIQKQNIPTGTA